MTGRDTRRTTYSFAHRHELPGDGADFDRKADEARAEFDRAQHGETASSSEGPRDERRPARFLPAAPRPSFAPVPRSERWSPPAQEPSAVLSREEFRQLRSQSSQERGLGKSRNDRGRSYSDDAE